jgi:hypothetical protein
MISVPNRHPVFVGVDWSVRFGTAVKHLPFVPLSEIDPGILAALKPLSSTLSEALHHLGQGYFIGTREAGMPPAEYPEMVLGADLPGNCIKWTKDIRLLLQSDTREKLQRKSHGETE